MGCCRRCGRGPRDQLQGGEPRLRTGSSEDSNQRNSRGLEMSRCLMRAAGGKEVRRREGLAASAPAGSITGPQQAISKRVRDKAAQPVGCPPHPEWKTTDQALQSSMVSGPCWSGLTDCRTPESRVLLRSFCFPVGLLLASLQTHRQCSVNILLSACVNGWRNSWSSINSY